VEHTLLADVHSGGSAMSKVYEYCFLLEGIKIAI